MGSISRQKAQTRALRQLEAQAADDLPLAHALHGNFGRDLANWLFPVYQVVIGIGWLLLYRKGSMAGEENGVRSLFTAVNAATLSGFGDVDSAAYYTDVGQAVILALIICGSLFAMIVGGLAIIRILRLRYSDNQLIAAAVLTQLAAMAVGTAVLLAVRSPAFTFWPALFQATAAFGNCGVSLSANLSAANPATHLVILPLAFIGGLGIPVLMEIYDRLFHRLPMSKNTLAALQISACVYLLAVVAIAAIAFAMASGTMDGPAARAIICESSTAVLQSRTLGLELVPMHSLPMLSQWLLVLVMAIGGASGGTAGGIKVNTLRAMYDGIQKTLHGENPGRIFGIACTWMAIYLGTVLAAIFLLTYVLRGANVDIPAAAVSAVSNVGITATRMPNNARGMLFGLCAIMLLGRMAPLMVLWWTAETTKDAEITVA